MPLSFASASVPDPLAPLMDFYFKRVRHTIIVSGKHPISTGLALA
jgi:hypothetical protein